MEVMKGKLVPCDSRWVLFVGLSCMGRDYGRVL